MDRKEFHEILRRYIEGKCSDEEKNLIDQWYELLDDESLPGLPPEELDKIKANILHSIRNSPAEISHINPIKSHIHLKKWYWLAAAILVGVIAGSFYFSGSVQQIKSYTEPYISSVTNDFIEKRNQSDHAEKIILDDKSIVTLYPGSGIKYPAHFREDKREVYMQGEAFFEVQKNPKRPFYVYNNSIITHVLGTSFKVSSDNINNTVQVDVRTGRVEVIENRDLLRKPASAKVNGIILTPNQKVIYHERSGQFEAALTDKPVPVIPENGPAKPFGNFVFEETALSVVLKEIEKQFGIEIVVEDENILDNPFTGDISKADLFVKLDLVCKSLSVCYEIKGTRILIRNHGCN